MLFCVTHLDASQQIFHDYLSNFYVLSTCYILTETYIYLSGLHTNYSLMDELKACKKAAGKIVRGAPDVSCDLDVLYSSHYFYTIYFCLQHHLSWSIYTFLIWKMLAEILILWNLLFGVL